MLSDTSLFFATFQGSAYSSNHGAPSYTNVGSLLKLQPVPASRIAVNDAGNLVAVVTPTAVYHVSCVATSRYRAAFVFAPTALCAQPLSTTHSCAVSAKIGAAMSNVNDTAVSSDGDLWIACWSGLAFVPKPGSAYSTAAAAASAITWVVTSEPLYAVALRPDGKRVVTGGGNKFYIVDADPSSPTCVTSDKSCAGHVYVCALTRSSPAAHCCAPTGLPKSCASSGSPLCTWAWAVSWMTRSRRWSMTPVVRCGLATPCA